MRRTKLAFVWFTMVAVMGVLVGDRVAKAQYSCPVAGSGGSCGACNVLDSVPIGSQSSHSFI